MPTSWLGLASVVMSFAGGVFLTLDSFRARKKTLAQFAAMQLAAEQVKSNGKLSLYETPDGRKLETNLDWQLWLVQGSLRWTWVGFLLISAGFLLDLLSRFLTPAS